MNGVGDLHSMHVFCFVLFCCCVYMATIMAGIIMHGIIRYGLVDCVWQFGLCMTSGYLVSYLVYILTAYNVYIYLHGRLIHAVEYILSNIGCSCRLIWSEYVCLAQANKSQPR